MVGYHDFSIDFLTSSPLLVWLAFLILIAFSVFTYYQTNPPLPKNLKILLGGLRILAVLALVASLFEPVMSFSREYERNRRISILIDRSESMEKVEQGKTRRARVDSLLSASALSTFEELAVVTKYQFGGLLGKESANLENDKTAIGEALYEVEKLELAEPADYRILFSDGSSNSGRSPLEAAGKVPSPIIAVDMSASTAEFDIAVTEVSFNSVVFAGQQTEIKAKLSWQGKPAKPITVRLYDTTKVLTEDRITANQEGGLAEISLKFIPDRPGQKILRISVPAQEKEMTDKNNSRSFAIKILKSKMLVLLVAAVPDYEVGFMKRFFENSDRYDVNFIATGRKAGNQRGVFPSQQTELNRYDMVVFYDPDQEQMQLSAEILKSYLMDRGGAVWILMGEKFAAKSSVKWLSDLLPFSQSVNNRIERRQFHAEPVEGNLLHPSNRLADDQQSIRQAWAQLPPFATLVKCDVVSSDATILADTPDPMTPEHRWPVTGFKRHGPGKVFATAGLPIWSWKFINFGFGGDREIYSKYMEGTSSWLTVTEDIEPVRIRPVKQVFSRGETVQFRGFAFDLGFRPLPGIIGSVRLEGGEGKSSIVEDLVPIEEGEFSAEFNNLSAGRYRWNGRFEKEGRSLKEESGEILVESYTLEEFDQGGTAMLSVIADKSGGKYFRFERFDEAAAMINTKPILVSHSGEIVIWGKLWLLILFISALSIEWLLRKLFQLI